MSQTIHVPVTASERERIERLQKIMEARSLSEVVRAAIRELEAKYGQEMSKCRT